MLNSNQPASDTDLGSMTPRPIVSVLNTVVEALRGGDASRLIESIIDQFNQLVGRIGQMYSDGVEREVYVVDRNPSKVDSKDRIVIRDLVTKMKLTQSNIEQLANRPNETELTAVEEKINSIKSNLNEIWANLKNMYSDYNQKSTNVTYILDRLDFLDPKQVQLTAGELQSQLNKLWKELSRNLMQTIDRVDLGVKKLTKQTLKSRRLNDDVDLVGKTSNSTHESTESGDSNGRLTNSTEFALLTSSSKKLMDLTRMLSGNLGEQQLNQLNQLKQTSNEQLSELESKRAFKQANEEDNSVDKMPLSRYLRSVDRLQMESEKLLNDDLKNLIKKPLGKLAKLQMLNDTETDEDDTNSNTNNNSNDLNSATDSSDSNSSTDSTDSNSSTDSSDPIDPTELDFQNESQLKKFTNMLRGQFNQSISQFTNYWRGIGNKINEHRKNFNQTTGRKLNFDRFNFRFGSRRDDDQDAAFYGSNEHLDDYSDYSSSYNSPNC